MAKKKGKTFGDRLARQLKVSMGPWWSDEGIQAINEIARQGEVEVGDATFGSLVLQPCLTFQHEMAVRDFDEQGKEFDDLSPFVYPELMRTWEHNSACVEFSEGATAVAFDSEPGFIQSVALDGLFDFFPGCVALDVRKLNVLLYNIVVDEVFVYPSYNAVNGHVALMFVGVNQNLGFTFAYEARLVLQGETFGDAARATNRVLEEERSACLGGFSTAPSEEFFSALDSEPELFAVTWRLLAALCSERVELVRQSWGRGESVKVRARKPESLQMVEGVHVGEGPDGQTGTAGAVSAGRADMAGEQAREEGVGCAGSTDAAAEEKAAVRVGAAVQGQVDGRVGDAGAAAGGKVAAAGGVVPGRAASYAEGAGTVAGGQVVPAGGAASRRQVASHEEDAGDQGQPVALADDGVAQGRFVAHAQGVDAPGEAAASGDEIAGAVAPSADAERAEEAQLERDLLQEELDRLRAELESQKSAAAFRARQLEDEARELRERVQGLEGRARLVETMDLPETPYEALSLAAKAFSDRIVVLDRARKSAEDFVKGDPGEVWAVLRSVAVTLHSLLFIERERGLANAFRDRTGYELALRDSKGANRNPDQKAERMVEYEGAVRDATMHIKGRGVRKGESLRVHFFVDYDKKKIIIAHCGEHLTTDRTSSM